MRVSFFPTSRSQAGVNFFTQLKTVTSAWRDDGSSVKLWQLKLKKLRQRCLSHPCKIIGLPQNLLKYDSNEQVVGRLSIVYIEIFVVLKCRAV